MNRVEFWKTYATKQNSKSVKGLVQDQDEQDSNSEKPMQLNKIDNILAQLESL